MLLFGKVSNPAQNSKIDGSLLSVASTWSSAVHSVAIVRTELNNFVVTQQGAACVAQQ